MLFLSYKYQVFRLHAAYSEFSETILLITIFLGNFSVLQTNCWIELGVCIQSNGDSKHPGECALHEGRKWRFKLCLPFSICPGKILSTSTLTCLTSNWICISYSFKLVSDYPISSQFCFLQLKIVQALQPLLEHGIYNNVRSNSMGGSGSVFRIADLGCATGINTLLAADTIVRAVKLTFIRQSVDVPEFQVFFADLPSNDFNTLFRTLPPLRADETTTGLTAPAARDQKKPPTTRSYFASAVSGSHYRRLFPRQTLNFCHSSTSLHWLSQVI